MAAAGIRNVLIRFTGESKGLNRTLDNSQKKTSKWASGLKKLAGLAAGAFAVAGIVKFGKDITALSRRIEDLDTKARTVFEDSLPQVRNWAKENSKSLGVTQREATGLAANFADLLKPMGFTSDQAAAMSTDVVGLSGALAKWEGKNRSAAEVADILSKAMLGERDSLKSLGISITEADVSARLAANGQENLTGAALQQAKAVATQELILEKSTDAQEAWANGGKAAEEQQNAWRVSVDELREKIAKGLTPVIKKVTEFMGKLAQWINTKGIPAAKRFAGWFKDNILPALKAVGGFIGDTVVPAIKSLAEWIGRNKEIIPAVGIAIAALLVPAFISWAVAAGAAAIATIAAAAPVILIGALIAGLAFLVIKNWDKIKEVTLKVFGAVWDFLKGLWNKITGAISAAIGFVKDLFFKFHPLGIIIKNWEPIWGFITGLWDKVIGFVTKLPGRIASAAAGLWNGIRDAFRNAINWIIDKWNGLSFTLPSVTVFGKTIGGTTISTPNIPRFHDGGISTREQLAVLRRNETVFTPEQMDALGRLVRGGDGSNIEVRVFIGDRELTDIVDVQVSKRNKGTVRRVNAGTGRVV